MKKSTLISLTILLQLISSNYAFAFFGIPGTPSLPGVCDPLECARQAERKQKCDQIRSDAEHHQKEISVSLAGVINELTSVNQAIQDRESAKIRLEALQVSLTQHKNLIQEFKNVNTGLVETENEMKITLLNMQNRAADQSLMEVLVSLEAQNENPSLKQLATIIQNLISQNQQELRSSLENSNAKNLLLQLAQLVGYAEVVLHQQQAVLDAEITNNTAETTRWTDRRTALNDQIRQLQAAHNAQEERKSCNF